MRLATRFFSGIYNLGLGLATTLKYLPGRAVTIQYPRKRMEMFERSRGMVVLLTNKETGKLNCNACLLCQKACPVGAITIQQSKDKDPDTKKRYPLKFEINSLICCYCGLCEESCNFDAIKMAPKYEFATPDKDALIHDMNRLQEIGLDVKYTPRKKRPAKKAAASSPAKNKTTETEKDEGKQASIETSISPKDNKPEQTDSPEDKS